MTTFSSTIDVNSFQANDLLEKGERRSERGTNYGTRRLGGWPHFDLSRPTRKSQSGKLAIFQDSSRSNTAHVRSRQVFPDAPPCRRYSSDSLINHSNIFIFRPSPSILGPFRNPPHRGQTRLT